MNEVQGDVPPHQRETEKMRRVEVRYIQENVLRVKTEAEFPLMPWFNLGHINLVLAFKCRKESKNRQSAL